MTVRKRFVFEEINKTLRALDFTIEVAVLWQSALNYGTPHVGELNEVNGDVL
jgi:hypothetical protein